MSFFEVFVVVAGGLEMFWLDVLAFHQQKASHVCYVIGKARARAFHDWYHDRQRFQTDQEREMKLANVVDVLVLSNGSAGDNENRGAFHRRSVWSAQTSSASFSRPCEATRI